MSKDFAVWQKAKAAGRKMSMVTAYDYVFGRMAEAAGLDAVLVGDSLGMMVAGEPDTLRVTMAQMAYHVRITARGVRRALLMADLPFGSFEGSVSQAFESAATLIKAGADIVKIEGGAAMVDTVAYLSARAIPVCAHIGLTPQHVRQLGGFRRQGKTPEAAAILREDAAALTQAGARMVLMEAIPSDLAAQITAEIPVPTIGIGAGPGTDAQVLVLHDILGLTDRAPSFAKTYVDGSALLQAALTQYAQEVAANKFPE
jgi:3-methyl-2-oxobutanoate hydroxymethyltransferase